MADRFLEEITALLKGAESEGDPASIMMAVAGKMAGEIVRLRGRLEICEEQMKLFNDALLFGEYQKAEKSVDKPA